MVLAKSALIMSMSIFLLIYIWKPASVEQPSSEALWYLAFVFAEIPAVVVALTHSLRDFLGIGRIKLPRLHAIGSLLCISSGILLVLFESAIRFPINMGTPDIQARIGTVFISMSDTSILCGLLIMAGGVLIVAGSSTLGAVISVIFGFFPPQLKEFIPPLPFPQQTTFHIYDLIMKIAGESPPLYLYLIAAIVGSLPIVGGLLALASVRRLRT